MADQHPIAPPQELIDQWLADAPNPLDRLGHVATQAARWGADQELEACCKWLEQGPFGFNVTANGVTDKLRDARRPKPPSLKEQASKSLDKVVECLKMLVPGASVDGIHIETIRRALEQLND